MSKPRHFARCRYCGCTDDKPCPTGCGWADDTQAFCTACQPVHEAWQRLARRRKPNMVRAFFRGFVEGAGDVDRQQGEAGPYGTKEVQVYWQAGFAAGRRSLVQRATRP